jgi:hypothetical protein
MAPTPVQNSDDVLEPMLSRPSTVLHKHCFMPRLRDNKMDAETRLREIEEAGGGASSREG